MRKKFRRLSALAVGVAVIVMAAIAVTPEIRPNPPSAGESDQPGSAVVALTELPVKGRAPKTDYSREQFGSGWAVVNGCDTRNIILYRDLESPQLDDECRVVSGVLNDPYTDMVIHFSRQDSSSVQIDHTVALSDAWQKGAQQLTRDGRIQFANDPLNLLAVDGPANQQKGDGDAATWLPANSTFRCEYVARQVAIKKKYTLWVTPAEKQAMEQVFSGCAGQNLPAK